MTAKVPPTLMVEGLYDARLDRMIHWQREQLEPLLIYRSETHYFVPFFSSFILKPLQTSSAHFLCGLQSAFKAGTKDDWLEWLKHLFGYGKWLDALSYVAAKYQRADIEVWIMLPYPYPHQQPFGDIKGMSGHFRNENHRLRALKWWMEAFQEEWMQHACSENIRLRGFVWGREGLPPFDRELVKRWNHQVHEYHLESLWLPNYKAAFVEHWPDLGFDHVALYPQYTGATENDAEWLDNTTKFALVHQAGIQMICGQGWKYSEDHFRKYHRQKVFYRQLGGKGPFVYRFPNHSLYRVFIEDRQRYDDVFFSL